MNKGADTIIGGERKFLAIADPPFRGRGAVADDTVGLAEQCRSGAAVPAELIYGLAKLPETREEARVAGQFISPNNAEILAGAEATEAALRQRDLSQYSVLYFATHGLLPGELKCLSEPGLALSPPAQPTDRPDQEWLTRC